MPSNRAYSVATGALLIGINKYFFVSELSQSSWWKSLFLFSLPFLCRMVWSCFLYHRYFSPLRSLPTPKGASFLAGHAFEFLKEPFGAFFRAWVNEIPHDGLIRALALFNEELLFVVGPAALADVLVHKCYDFEKPWMFRSGGLRVLGDGIIFAEGEVHTKQRKNLMPAFTFRAIKNLYPMFWEKSQALVQSIIAQGQPAPSIENPQGIEIEVNGWASKAALDIIGVSALDVDFDSLREPGVELSQIYRRIFSPTFLGMALDTVALFIPTWLYKLLPVQRERDFHRSFQIIKECVYARVSAQDQASRIQQAAQTDIISVALDSGHFTESEIVQQMMTFVVAGHETTATALTWAIYLLCKYPEIQTRLREELTDASLPNATDSNSAVTSTAIDSLPYLAAVCNETLRLYPPVALTQRSASRDTSILGHPIPKGTIIVVIPWAVNTATALWGPDAEEFRPERWLEPGKANSGGAESNYAFLTFLQGPRSCIGQAFAKGELMCLLAAWVGSFETTLSNPEKEVVVDVNGGISVKPKGGLWVKVKPLKTA